jgi:hypothetical protein
MNDKHRFYFILMALVVAAVLPERARAESPGPSLWKIYHLKDARDLKTIDDGPASGSPERCEFTPVSNTWADDLWPVPVQLLSLSSESAYKVYGLKGELLPIRFKRFFLEYDDYPTEHVTTEVPLQGCGHYLVIPFPGEKANFRKPKLPQLDKEEQARRLALLDKSERRLVADALCAKDQGPYIFLNGTKSLCEWANSIPEFLPVSTLMQTFPITDGHDWIVTRTYAMSGHPHNWLDALMLYRFDSTGTQIRPFLISASDQTDAEQVRCSAQTFVDVDGDDKAELLTTCGAAWEPGMMRTMLLRFQQGIWQ